MKEKSIQREIANKTQAMHVMKYFDVRPTSNWKASASIIFYETRLDSLHGKNGLQIPGACRLCIRERSYAMLRDIVG